MNTPPDTPPPDWSDSTTPPPDSGQRRRHWKIPALIATAVLALAGIAAGLLLTAGPGSITVHGTSEDCTGSEQSGLPVTVLNSAQNVIGTGTLADDNSKAAAKLALQYDKLQLSLGALSGSGTSGMSLFKFTAQVPAGQPRYGIQVGSGRGTVWFSESQMRAGPGLNLGC